MARKRSWTDEQLRVAVAAGTSIKSTMRNLGLSSGGSGHYEIRARIAKLRIDTTHFAIPGSGYPWTEAELRVAVASARSQVGVLASLGFEPLDGLPQRLRRHMSRLGLRLVRPSRATRWSEPQLRDAVGVSRSFRGVLVLLGLVPAGGNYQAVQRHIRELDISTAHFTGKGWNRGRSFDPRPMTPLEQVLVPGRWTSSQSLKKRLVQAGLKQMKCELCSWAEVSIDGRTPVELDHINGDHDDNRFENLRILCPNCHSLQLTHRGSNQRRRSRS